jgi:acetyltransferase-like isoleucine patch superfamily enzyme
VELDKGAGSIKMAIQKERIKQWAGWGMIPLSLFFYGVFVVLSKGVGPRKAFASVMQTVSLVPGIFGEWLRRGVLQQVTGAELTNCCISFGTLFSDPDIKIHDGVYLGPRCDIGRAVIGRNCVIGSNVHIVSGRHQHGFDDLKTPIRDQAGTFDRVCIGEDCWIGNAAVVCAHIGAHCVIGAGSVVLEPVPDYAVVGGNPATVLYFRQLV